jgi:peptidoglycan-associated lipoprotein
MRFASGRVCLLSVALLLAASLAACASRPKPMGPAATASPPPAAAPSTPPPVSEAPVTETQEGAVVPGSERDFVINAGDRVYFDLDSYDLRSDARPVLDAQAAWLSRYPSVRVRIEGNCDERGTREYNFALGARRANSVRDYLAGRGISPNRMETVSFGKERPIDTGENEQAWSRNRNAHTAITAGSR